MIFCVEDDNSIRDLMIYTLTIAGFEAKGFAESGSFWQEMQVITPELILLDIMLPELNGLEVLRRLKKEKDTPVILLTARDAVMDKVSGLDAGAVDYVTKPFAIEELLARIRVALKLHSHQGQGAAAAQASVEGQLAWGPLLMDIPRHRVTMNGHEIALTNREFLMLQTLLENTDIVLSRDTLLERVCGYEYAGETNVIDVYIRYLRSKIDDVFSVQMIRTVRGVGYVINKWEDSGESRL